jgi:hypothetical protein
MYTKLFKLRVAAVELKLDTMGHHGTDIELSPSSTSLGGTFVG